jgi:hypothetical protein
MQMETGTEPRLLFVTSAAALGNNIGRRAAERILAGLAERAAVVLADIEAGSTSHHAAASVRDVLRSESSLDGVVLVGGYDVVPAQRVDSLGPSLRRSLPPTPDQDDFTVWSDDVYGDVEDDRLPELPVSRVPDCYSAEFLERALRPEQPALATRSGLRNNARPFASRVFRLVPGEGKMLRSEKVVHDQQPPYGLGADAIYLMLHGEHDDGTRFLGESKVLATTALTLANVPDAPGAVVLSGCCWGGLTVETRAVDATSKTKLRQRSPDTSIALRFLAKGARAYVGCTGSHFSPMQPPYHYNGGPLHRAFWRRCAAGMPPARALFEAKFLDYAPKIPHGREGTVATACECKVLREFTCLGLGW